MTPEQAWEHVRALWPDAAFIVKNGLHPGTIYQCQESFCEQHADFTARIEWPEGVVRWPPREPQYREPTPADVGKMVQVRDYADHNWRECELLAVLPSKYKNRFLVDFAHAWTSFRFTRIAIDEPQPCPIDAANTARLAQLKEPTHPDAQPIATAPQDRIVWLWMGGRWMTGRYGVGSCRWITTLQPDGMYTGFDWDSENQPTHWREIH